MLKSVNNKTLKSLSLSSPDRGTSYFDDIKIMNMYEKIENCGVDNWEVINSYNEIFSVPKYCDNRCCSNPDCKRHRLYKFLKEHKAQINDIRDSIKSPKAWVFTGWQLELPIDRDFCREKLRLLYKLLSNPEYGSITKFSIHMELKFSKKNDYKTAYLHFHVVSGGIRNLKHLRFLWGRQIKFEYAIKPDSLAYYISKYSSKTPYFPSEKHLQEYHLAVYKTRMHLFSSNVKNIKSPSEYVILDHVIDEIRRELYSTSYLNPRNSSTWRNRKAKRYYHPFIEPPPKGGGNN